MSRASNALTTALSELGMKQTTLARSANMQLSQVNRFVRGTGDMGPGSLALIARVLPERQRADVISAWLRDQIPEVASGLVSIQATTTPRAGDGPRPWEAAAPGLADDLSPQLHQAIGFLIGQARRHQPISDLLIDLELALRGDETSRAGRN